MTGECDEVGVSDVQSSKAVPGQEFSDIGWWCETVPREALSGYSAQVRFRCLWHRLHCNTASLSTQHYDLMECFLSGRQISDLMYCECVQCAGTGGSELMYNCDLIRRLSGNVIHLLTRTSSIKSICPPHPRLCLEGGGGGGISSHCGWILGDLKDTRWEKWRQGTLLFHENWIRIKIGLRWVPSKSH